jgi:tetratricopeptide (TPR) repeat protein
MNYDQWRYNLRGTLFELLRQPQRAIDAYRESFRSNPRHAGTARTIAWLEARHERWAEAERWFRQAIELEPDDGDTWFNLGYVQDKGGRDADAIAWLRRAGELNPKNDRAWYGLGMLLARRGDHAGAAAALDQAAQLQPMNGLAWYALGMAWHHCNAPDKVEAVIRHTLTHDPQTAQRLVRDAGRSDLAHLLP